MSLERLTSLEPAIRAGGRVSARLPSVGPFSRRGCIPSIHHATPTISTLNPVVMRGCRPWGAAREVPSFSLVRNARTA